LVVDGKFFSCLLLCLDFDAHLAGGAAERAESGFFATGVHILHLDFDEIHDLLLGEFCDLGLVRLLGTGGDACGLLQKNTRRRGFRDEGEALVLVDRDDHGKNVAGLLLRGGVELLAEGHDVDALLTERGTDRGSGVGLSSRDLKFDLSCDFFGHGVFRKKVWVRRIRRKRVEIKAELLLRHKRFLDFFDLLCISPISQYLMRITGTEPTNLTGSLLVALPTLLDPNFRRTILFLVKHDPTEGAMGVILNRPTEYRLPDLDDLVPDGLEKVPVFEGGPVEKHQLILARMIVAETATRFEALDREIRNPLANLPQGELRAFVGYAGWTSGQLEREIAEKSWITLPPTPELLTLVASDEEGSVLWRSIMKRLGPMYHLMAQAPDDPGLN